MEYTQDGTVDLRGRPVLAHKTGKWKACSFLIGYEAFERMAFYGIASNLVVYLTTQLHEDTVSSVRNVNNWAGSVWITPILGAYIADSYLGRFWTFTISSLIYVMGMILLTMAVSIESLRPACENGLCSKASRAQVAFFYTSLYVIAVGAGGTKPNISTLGADQFDDLNPEEKKLKASFFNWWMFSTFCGALFATMGLVYVQENVGWAWGYGIPTGGLVLSLGLFYVGTPLYRHKVRRTRHPAGEVFRVFVTAIANARLEPSRHYSELHELDNAYYERTGKRKVHHTPVFRFLDLAATKPTASTRLPCTVTQVESAKLVLSMSTIWATTLIPSTIWAQINTLFVKQGTTLDRHITPSFEIPAASLSSLVTLSMLAFLPVYDRCLVPLARRHTGNPRGITLLQRLAIGFAIQTLAIASACLVSTRRHAGATSILWLFPQYVLVGVGDVFSAVGMLEFFYDQSPDEMRSLGTTFFTSGIGVGNFFNSLLVTAVEGATRGRWIGRDVNESRLDCYYGLLLVLSVVNLAVFVAAARKYVYKVEDSGEDSVVVKEVCGEIE
ncbi:major facilitator superfamily protein [Striga asiatica]|uniref:Major facilitator superfamily protein n=1 Tax=Striga asiatica TaxID=4170 RepID=A0A5A7QZN7_STRAF|nr:major facilitator superfamily protein [Striga asiatica]